MTVKRRLNIPQLSLYCPNHRCLYLEDLKYPLLASPRQYHSPKHNIKILGLLTQVFLESISVRCIRDTQHQLYLMLYFICQAWKVLPNILWIHSLNDEKMTRDVGGVHGVNGLNHFPGCSLFQYLTTPIVFSAPQKYDIRTSDVEL